jgi:hypothetical protein
MKIVGHKFKSKMNPIYLTGKAHSKIGDVLTE